MKRYNSTDKNGKNNSNVNDKNTNSKNHSIIINKNPTTSNAVTLKLCLAWGIVLLWMALIFYFSHQPATESSQLSQGVLTVILGFVQRVSPDLARELELLQLNHLIRKNAHFVAYLVLAVLSMNALAQNRIRGKRQIGYAFLICLLYAITDEVHQLFIPGRSGEVKDVLLDSFGAISGILLYRLPAVFRQIRSNTR